MLFIKHPKLILLVLPMLLLLNSSGDKTIHYGGYHTTHILQGNINGPCPEEVNDNRKIMKDFLSSSDWEQVRQESNTNFLTISQITLLQSPQNTSTCEIFNNRYSEAISTTYSDGSAEHEITYYKVNDYYFVIISRRQPSDPDIVASGIEIIHIFDENLNFIKGYFF